MALGSGSLSAATANSNIGIGLRAGDTITTGTSNIFIGTDSDGIAGNANQIVFGADAVATAANQIMMGRHRVIDMTMDCPPITVKQTSTSGVGIGLEHEGSTAILADFSEHEDCAWFNLKHADGTTLAKIIKEGQGSSHILRGTASNFGIGDPSPNSSFSTIGSISSLITSGSGLITSTHTVGTHHTMLYDTSGGAVTANLPAVSAIEGRTYTFKLVTAGNALTIDASGDERIDGATTYATAVAKTAVTIMCDSVGWQIISEYTP